MDWECTPTSEQPAATWIARCGRFGYIVKGSLYIIIGILALYLAIEVSDQAPTAQHALELIFFRPLGGVLLGIVTLGLFSYAAWQGIAAVVDGEHDGSDILGIFMRLGKVWGAVVYLLLALQAVQLLLWHLTESEQLEAWTATALRFSLGRGLLGITGAGILGFGLYQFYQAYAMQERRTLELRRRPIVTLALWLGRWGFVARGVVFVLMGAFLILAVARHNPERVSGLGDVLLIVEHLPFGPWLLGALALGFIAYGLYEGVKGYYRRLDVGPAP